MYPGKLYSKMFSGSKVTVIVCFFPLCLFIFSKILKNKFSLLVKIATSKNKMMEGGDKKDRSRDNVLLMKRRERLLAPSLTYNVRAASPHFTGEEREVRRCMVSCPG